MIVLISGSIYKETHRKKTDILSIFGPSMSFERIKNKS